MGIENWLPPLIMGVTFTSLGLAKFYGLAKGIKGGGNISFTHKLCAT